ncbi:MAG TPA: DnaB-like helicase C-terminal domain-containing protein, partial [Candidatus Nanoarchaeia archaeon]|nr:DnaB-like helicase C-terminal domain-containing protein [Candidatus Nanoarchaeia archaeon]
ESGIGKSIGLENFGINAWENNFNVLYLSLEMPKNQIGFRMDSRVMRMLYSKFRKGEFSKKEMEEWKHSIERYRKTKSNFFEIVSFPRGCRPSDIEMEAERTQDKHGKKVDIIIVDYLNIMTPNFTKANVSDRDWKGQVDVAWELKEIATDFDSEGVVVWTGNQIKDEAEKADFIQKKHFKYGRGIIEVSNIAVALAQSADDELEDVMSFQIVKVRDIEKIEPITLRPNYDIMTLHDEVGHFNDLETIRRKQAKKRDHSNE